MRGKARRAAEALCLIALALPVTGCGRLLDYARVVDANRLHEKGDYQGAIVSYLKSGPSSFRPTLEYDLANTYARLGEYEAAARLYGEAERGGDRGIAADSFFNEGVALFERGRYEESWKAFRSSLAGAEPGGSFAREACRNLELAWRAWKKSGLAPPRGAAPSSRGASDRDESELRLLQRLETGRWRPGGSSPPPASYMDY
jgi:tetratricopeptide (TPR) repeat protein